MKSLDTASLTWKELQVILDRGETLQHVRQVGDLIRKDFRGQVKFFHQNISLQARVADRLYSTKEVVDGTSDTVKVIPYATQGRLFQSFKIKPQTISSRFNFISNTSLIKICQRSHASLQDVCIRNGQALSNEALVAALSMCSAL